MGSILILAGSAQRRRSATAALAPAGHRIAEAADGEQALAALRGGRIEVLLVDILMPHPGGYQFVCDVYAMRESPRPRMVFLASAGMAGEARLLVQVSGFAGAVVDPSDAAGLKAAVDAALSQAPPAGMRAAGQDRLYPLVSRLCGRVADLERTAARLQSRLAIRSAQLEEARAALDREIARRIDAEKRLARRCRFDSGLRD